MKADPFVQARLLDLQALDTRLRQIDHARSRVPQIAALAEAERELQQVSDDLVRVETTLSDIRREVQRAEDDVQLVRDRAARDQSRLDAGTGMTSRDLTSLQHEIESLARRQAELEDVEIEVLERQEAAEGRVSERTAEQARMQREVDRLREERDAVLAELDAERGQVAAPRDDLVASIDDPLVALYDRIRESSGGLAAAELKHGRCGGCQLELNPVDLAAIDKAPVDEVVRCEECDRILVRIPGTAELMARSLRVEADGGSRGNPGVAGYGALVRDSATGELLVELAAPLGTASNNVAEYRGLLAGLRAVLTIDAGADVEVAMDSKLVVEQMAGRWKIKHPDMRVLALEGRDLVAQITTAGGSVDFTWIPRERNSAADALSNRGMDGDEVEDWHGSEGSKDDLTPSRDGEQEPVRPWPGRGPRTRVVLVRHGVTAFTEQSRLDGRGGADPDLSPTGREQAERAAGLVEALVGDESVRVVTSDLTRARSTGQVIAERLGVAPETDRDWDEQSFGDWDGAAISDLLSGSADDFRALRDDPDYARPGGETHAELAERVGAAWERVVASGGTVVVASHRKPILVVLALVLGLPHDRLWRLAGSPGSLTAIEAWSDGEAVVAFTNRT